MPWRESITLAVGVVARLGYTVLARESGRDGEETAATAVLVARVTTLLSLTCSWATRASRAAT